MLNMMLIRLMHSSTENYLLRVSTFVHHSFSMMIHLESGICESGVDCDRLDRLGYFCYQSDDYTNDWNAYYKYKCPHCQTKFRFLSGLFQHVESDARNQQLQGTSIGKLENFISIKV